MRQKSTQIFLFNNEIMLSQSYMWVGFHWKFTLPFRENKIIIMLSSSTSQHKCDRTDLMHIVA